MNKLRYALLLLALFASAALLAQGGPQGGPGQGEMGAGRHMPSVDDQLANLSEKLNLTDAQEPQVKTILQDQRDKMKEVMDNSSGSREETHAKMRGIHEAANAKIRAVLTGEQKAKFDKMQEEHRKHMGEKHEGGEGAPPNPQQ